jgi:uncharacterized membrane-anchored protein YhcB (DUF1043 family)
MCTCVETIKNTFVGVKKQTDEIDVCSSNVDSFLDRINSIRKPVEEVTRDILQFVELVRDHFIELNAEDSASLLNDFIKTRQKMYEAYNKLRYSTLYVGMKNAVKEFRHSADLFSEMCEDLQKYNVQLSQDSDYQNLTERLNAIA